MVGFTSCESKNEATDEIDEITIYGNVIDRTTGHPLYNVLIQEKNKVGGSTVTGNDGNYEFTLPLKGSSDGKYYLVASKDKYSVSEYELEMSQVDKNRRVKVDFQLVKESITYTGTVLDSKNQPVFDAHISAKYYNTNRERYWDIGTTTMTDINGVYTMELPRPADYDQWKFAITATKSGYFDLTHTLDQNVDDMGKIITLNFILESNLITISGKVTNSNGQPIENASIYDWVGYGDYSKDWKVSTTQTNSNGEYELVLFTSYTSSGYVYRFHTLECEVSGYKSQTQALFTADSDGGKSYTFDFTLTKN